MALCSICNKDSITQQTFPHVVRSLHMEYLLQEYKSLDDAWTVVDCINIYKRGTESCRQPCFLCLVKIIDLVKATYMMKHSWNSGQELKGIAVKNLEKSGSSIKSKKNKVTVMNFCDEDLSPVRDSKQLKKRLDVHNSTLTSSATTVGGVGTEVIKGGGGGSDTTEELMKVIMENEGDYVFILSLSGKMVKETSSKAELRQAYFSLSTKTHPDKNPGSLVSKKAYQAVLESFECLANPQKCEEEDDDDGNPKKKQKKERVTRDNDGCFRTQIRCPTCKDEWNTKKLGLKNSAYNFFMQGVKQYICGGCFAKFGCMTAYHFCPHCKKSFEYDPNDYHRKISCGDPKCTKTFGFMMFKVSESLEVEIRHLVKAENEETAKKRAKQKQRMACMDKRVGTQTNEERVQEQLFLLKLVDNCPRCGWELERGMRSEDAKVHLHGCKDQKAKAEKKDKLEESQEEVIAFKTWEHNGRQVEHLGMLSEITLKKECKKFNLSTEGFKHELIARLGKVISSSVKWRSGEFRTRHINLLDKALNSMDSDKNRRNPKELEQQVFQVAQNEEEYVSKVSNLVAYFNKSREVKKIDSKKTRHLNTEDVTESKCGFVPPTDQKIDKINKEVATGKVKFIKKFCSARTSKKHQQKIQDQLQEERRRRRRQ